MTNVSRLPVVEKDLFTFDNVDWVDRWYFYGAGTATAVRDASHSRGTVSTIIVDPDTKVTTYRVVISDVSTSDKRFTVTDLAGALIAEGIVGVPVFAGGLTFTLSTSGGAFVVGDGFSIGVSRAPLDISGIRFDGALRPTREAAFTAYDPRVLLEMSTEGAMPWLFNGGATGILTVVVPRAIMAKLPFGPYDYDLIATADDMGPLAARGTIAHDDGVTHL